MDLYADNILDHYRHPRCKAILANASVTHRELNTSCGDDLTVSLRLAGDRIVAVGWEGQGCAISQAGMSILSETLIDKTTTDVAALSAKDMCTLLGVPVGPRRMKCALLALHALKNAIRAQAGRPPQTWTETLGNTN